MTSLDRARGFASRGRDHAEHTAHGVSAWTNNAAKGFGRSAPWLQIAGVAAAGFAAGVVILGGRKVAMQATTAWAGDWFRQLKVEHRLAETLFEAGLRTDAQEVGKRTAILAHLAYALIKHGLQEETVVYPALRDADKSGEAKKLAAEHFDIKSYLHDLSEMAKDDPRWIKVWDKFYALVKHHVREEEQDVFPQFHEKMTGKQNRHLTLAMNREGIKIA